MGAGNTAHAGDAASDSREAAFSGDVDQCCQQVHTMISCIRSVTGSEANPSMKRRYGSLRRRSCSCTASAAAARRAWSTFGETRSCSGAGEVLGRRGAGLIADVGSGWASDAAFGGVAGVASTYTSEVVMDGNDRCKKLAKRHVKNAAVHSAYTQFGCHCR